MCKFKKIILIIIYFIILFSSLFFINDSIVVLKTMPETFRLLNALSLLIYPSILLIFTIAMFPIVKKHRMVMKGVLFFSVIARCVPLGFSIYKRSYSIAFHFIYSVFSCRSFIWKNIQKKL